ncbi:MAG: NAD(P)H-quinone oxidoreductase [Acidobacteriaceae bacterium]|nr:NAD(P)H-quinone oxidoreductase [Acidobacteriaceae bacterium]
MLAIEISTFGPPEVLRPVDRPIPEPGPDEVLIRVAAAGVSRADIMQRQGAYPPPPGASDIPGLDLAGTVEAVGAAVKHFHVGDRVCAIVTGGAYAEYCVAPVLQVLPVPENWSTVEAATLPENLFTVYDNLITRAQLKGGETILIHGGASGIGSTAIMLSKLWNAIPIATAGSRAGCDAAIALGAVHAIHYKESDFVTEVKRVTEGRGVDVVADILGGAYLGRNLECLATEGRIAIIALQGGRTGELDLGRLMQKRARVMGSTMRVRTPLQKGEIARALLENIWPLLPAKNPFRPVVDSTFPLAQASLAHRHLEEGGHIGKIVLVTA